jgi:hypothetical protein
MKALIVALLTANVLALAWWQGWLSPLLDPPGASQREPLRAARQLRPEALKVTPSRVTSTRPGAAQSSTP